jgi:polar amino acid transport system substrate-binding protein
MRAHSRVADIVQHKKIRVGLFPSFFYETSPSGERRGFAVSFATAIAEAIGVVLELIEYTSPPDAVRALKTGLVDVAFLGLDRSRAEEVDFTPPYMKADFTFLVPAGSSIRSLADIDKAGTRIAVVRNHAMEIALKGKFNAAERILAETPDIAFDILRRGEASTLAGIRPGLLTYALRLPASQVLEEAYGANILAMAVAKGRTELLSYLSDFIEQARTGGLLQGTLESAGLRGIQVVTS